MNRDFLMLAKTFDAKKHGIGGWFLSEKLDGMRAFWDGGLSRGVPKHQIPWANHDGDARYVKTQIATGLWSRLGNVIHAPDWWLDQLPAIMLDGELWHGVRGHGQRQILTRYIKTIVPGPEWKKVNYHVFDMPSPAAVFHDGRINNTNFKKMFKGFREWVDHSRLDYVPTGSRTRFERTVREMQKRLSADVVVYHPQERLPFQTSKALEIVENRLFEICSTDGEGLMLRKPESWWHPKRMDTILKVKKLDDDEGIVTGYITGRETDKGSKLLGLMGALILNYNGKRLELSGFTDEERRLVATQGKDREPTATQWARDHPEQEVPAWISAAHFPRGSIVTFRYRGTSLDGIPTEARYHRVRTDV
jgi:DNA ligase-1